MVVPFVKLHDAEKARIAEGVFAEQRALLERGSFILGEAVEQFEKNVARRVGTKHAVGVNSGLDALILVLRSLGISAGDEVITAPNSFVASAAAISLVGARPVFADVGEDYNLDPDRVLAALTSRTKAVLTVHLTGQPSDLRSLEEELKRRKIHLIEDAAQAIGAKLGDRLVGTLGIAGCFSLHPLKNLHVWGDGGFITTDDTILYQQLLKQRNHGLRDRDHVEFFSYNSRLDAFQAVVANASLERVDEINRRRNDNARRYDAALEGISETIKLPKRFSDRQQVYHVYQICCSVRDQLREHLSGCGIETKIHYPIPLHLQAAAATLGYREGDFPATERLSREILSLPIRENLDLEEQRHVINSIKEFVASAHGIA